MKAIAMTIKAIRMAVALASVALISASLTSAGGQKSSAGNSLSGTSWRLVKFQGPDDRTFAPDDKSKYTIKFGSDRRVVVRVDCNRGSSTWRVTAKGELQFGSWSRTSAKCGPGSLHDQIVTEGGGAKLRHQRWTPVLIGDGRRRVLRTGAGPWRETVT